MKKRFDLCLLDTIIWQTHEYRVITIKRGYFEIRRIERIKNGSMPQQVWIRKKDYLEGIYKMRKANLPPVQCYVSELLKK